MNRLKTGLTLMLIFLSLLMSNTEAFAAYDNNSAISFSWGWIVFISAILLGLVCIVTIFFRVRKKTLKDINLINARHLAMVADGDAWLLSAGIQGNLEQAEKLLEEIEGSLTPDEQRQFLVELNDVKTIFDNTKKFFSAINDSSGKAYDDSLSISQYETITTMIKSRVIPAFKLMKNALETCYNKLNDKKYIILRNLIDDISNQSLRVATPAIFIKSQNLLNDCIGFIVNNRRDIPNSKQYTDDLRQVSTELLALGEEPANDQDPESICKKFYTILNSGSEVLNQVWNEILESRKNK